jgi:hypothetical protein
MEQAELFNTIVGARRHPPRWGGNEGGVVGPGLNSPKRSGGE